MSTETSTTPGSDPLVCSARGCRAVARYGLRWNNPRLHEPQRRKVWLSCPDHREQLSAFLRARGFLREVVDVSDLHTTAGSFADLADLTGSVPTITDELVDERPRPDEPSVTTGE